ncbi:MAG: hypothetical protein KC643_30940 [Nitrospira sp.]|nr:hypothetical protein [Nitrospira sp.]
MIRLTGKGFMGWILAFLVVLLACNLIWLGTSTVSILNASNHPVPSVAYRACETTHHLGTLQPGQSKFRFLQACGDDTLEILVGDSRFCQIYVEGELYHVDATISGEKVVSCAYDDLLSSLFVMKILR